MARRLIVDAMNVIGSRPTGWWRNRRGAMREMVDELTRYAEQSGEPVIAVLDSGPFELPDTAVDVRFASRRGPDAADDEIVKIVDADADPGSLVVATSDRRLAERVRALGADVIGAGSMRRMLDATLEHVDETEDLRSEQERKLAEEKRRAREAESEEDTKTHERRAEKSEYLREKLAERERSERED